MGFYGNIHFKQSTVKNVVYELLENIVNWDIRNIVIIASHADPVHIIAVEEACSEINKKYGVCTFSPMGSLFSAHELGIDINLPDEIKSIIEQYPNDFHAGWIETSNMLEINSSLIKTDYQNVPDTFIEAKDMVSSERVHVAMGKYGHLGYPRLANIELGSLLNENTINFLSQAVLAFIERINYEKYEHHFLYKLPYFRQNYGEN